MSVSPGSVPQLPLPLQESLGAELAATSDQHARSVLVVDDNALARSIACAALEKRGYQVFEAGNGETAIKLLAQHRPALILLDLHLPDVDGVAMVSQLRAVPAGAEIPILAFSGLMSKMQRARALRAGYTDYVFKTAEPLDLVSMVDSYLAVPQVAGTKPGVGHRVLVVDDDPVQGRLTARQMGECGFQVELVFNAAAALASARLSRPDAIVADLLMPGMNGMDLCLAVRRDTDLARIPVIITSSTFSVIDDVDRQLAAEIAADSFVERTPSCAEVIDKLVEVIARTLPMVPGAQADAMSTEFVGRQLRQLKHQAWINASLMRQAATNSTLLSIMTGAADILTREHDLPTLLHDVLARALDASGISAGAILLLNESGRLTLSAQVGFPDAALENLAEMFGEREIFERLALGQNAVEIPSPAVNAASAEAVLIKAGASALIVAPLLTGGTSGGALLLRARGPDLDDGLVTSVTAVASQLGQAVMLSRTVERLRRSELRYRSLYEGIPTGVFRSDANGHLLDFNPELIRLAGAPDRAALLGASTLPFYVRPDDRDAWQALVARDGEVRDFETPMRQLDGTPIWVAISARAIAGLDASMNCFEGTITDITKRKEAELQLDAAQSRLRRRTALQRRRDLRAAADP